MSRYLVGIDLGTTHTVVAYADSAAPDREPEVLLIDQLVAPGEVAARPLLASMRYHPAAGEIAEGDLVLPWKADPTADTVPGVIVGALAQELGSKVPGRLVTSAKSWLSHSGVDRTAPILPWGAPQDVPRVSPVEASASYLRHVRRSWDHRFRDHPLADQDIVLTVPASFDEVARRLSVEAAHLSGLQKIRLVEEPQAACYDWLAAHAAELEDALVGVRTLLICDVGGGTTDLTLIRVEHSSGGPQLSRIGVGSHLMLGGDNMDLALAHLAERRLLRSGDRLGAAQLSQLVQQCRSAKERLLAPEAPETATVTVLGIGSRLIGRARTTEITRDEARQLVVEGFFPQTNPHELPQRKRAGIVEFGLPYASDPAVTRHLAAFLADHVHALRAAADQPTSQRERLPVPDALLLNGGVFRGAALSRRVLEVLTQWRGDSPILLRNDRPDLAVARGAVAYALARRGRGARIGGGSARGFLLLVEDAQREGRHAVCMLPRGAEEGREMRLENRVFSLRLGQPVRFDLVTTTGDRCCSVGELVDVDQEHFELLPPLATVLASDEGAGSISREVPVELAAALTDVGTLEIHCVARDDAPPELRRRWRMEFQLRGRDAPVAATGTGPLPPAFALAAARIDRVYGPRVANVGPQEVKTLQRDLEKILGRRATWDTQLLRELFGTLWDGAKRRRRSVDHERLWFNLTGFCVRPGYGHPLDDWRIRQLWSLYEQGVQFTEETRNWSAWWTLWRRVAGGLDSAQHLQLLSSIESRLASIGQRSKRTPRTSAYDDMVRLAASLERLPATRKAAVGDSLQKATRKPTESPQRWWALGRLGARVPLYGSAHDVVSPQIAAVWLEHILRLDWGAVEPAAFAATRLSQLCGDRERDLDGAIRNRVVDRLRKEKAPAKWVSMVLQVTEIDSADESRILGDSLPPGLRLVR